MSKKKRIQRWRTEHLTYGLHWYRCKSLHGYCGHHVMIEGGFAIGFSNIGRETVAECLRCGATFTEWDGTIEERAEDGVAATAARGALARENGCRPIWNAHYKAWCCGCEDELHCGDQQSSIISSESAKRKR
jgi:hypothetical protein